MIDIVGVVVKIGIIVVSRVVVIARKCLGEGFSGMGLQFAINGRWIDWLRQRRCDPVPGLQRNRTVGLMVVTRDFGFQTTVNHGSVFLNKYINK